MSCKFCIQENVTRNTKTKYSKVANNSHTLKYFMSQNIISFKNKIERTHILNSPCIYSFHNPIILSLVYKVNKMSLLNPHIDGSQIIETHLNKQNTHKFHSQFAYMQQLTLGFPDLHQKDYCRILQEQMQRIMDQCQRLHMVVIWTQTMQMIDEVALHIKIGHNVYIKGTLLWRCIIPSCTLLLMMLFFEIFIQHVVWTIIVRLQN